MKYSVKAIDGNNYTRLNSIDVEVWLYDKKIEITSEIFDEKGNKCNIANIISKDYNNKNFPSNRPENLSGLKTAKLPYELKELNFGGFLAPLFWGLSHHVKSSYFLLIIIILLFITSIILAFTIKNFVILRNLLVIFYGVLPLFFSIIYLIKGNESAWKSHRFSSIEDFKKYQKTLIFLGCICCVLVLRQIIILFTK